MLILITRAHITLYTFTSIFTLFPLAISDFFVQGVQFKNIEEPYINVENNRDTRLLFTSIDGLEVGSLEWHEKILKLFKDAVGNNTEISREDFKKLVVSKNQFFCDRVFDIFDVDKSGSISLQKFLDAMRQFAGKSPNDKIKFLFKIYDIEGGELIYYKNLKEVINACLDENQMKFSEEQIENLTTAMFEDADTEKKGAITFDALKKQLEKNPGLVENMSDIIDLWLVPINYKSKKEEKTLSEKLTNKFPYQLSTQYLKNNYTYLIFLLMFIIINIGLFISRTIEYSYDNVFVALGRGSGQCLNFTSSFVLVLMLRRSITFLRSHGCAVFLPLDKHIYLHKVTGFFILFYSFLHSLMHLLNLALVIVPSNVKNPNNYTDYEWMFTMKPQVLGLIPGLACPTGLPLLFIVIIMVICSLPFVRRSGYFEIFYWTHLLYVPFWMLLVIHAPNFWKWFLVPGFIYTIECFIGFIIKYTTRGRTSIVSYSLLPSRVTHLVIKKPHEFDFCPGDYLFVNIPKIAKFEWHPFTISSAPEQDDFFSLHIRSVGQWTNKVYDYFKKEERMLTEINENIQVTELGRSIAQVSTSIIDIHDANKQVNNYHNSPNFNRKLSLSPIYVNSPIPTSLEIIVDGPFGAPSSHIFRAQHAVLIGTGIGVTPFASILQSIMHRYWNERHTCPNCQFVWAGSHPASVMKLKKVDFFWINRDQRSFEWFVNLLSTLEIEQAKLGGVMERFLDMHMYITSALQKTDMKAVGLQLALDLLHKKEQRDLITGLKKRTIAGRPDWDKIFQDIRDQRKGKVTVFYCGPPQLSRTLRVKCDQFGFNFRKENF